MGEVHVMVNGRDVEGEAALPTAERSSRAKDWCREHPYAEDTLTFCEGRFIHAEAFLSVPQYASGGEGDPRVTIEVTFQPGTNRNSQLMRFLHSEVEGLADLFAGSSLKSLVEGLPMRANTVLSVSNNGSRLLDIEPSVAIRLTRHNSYPIVFQLREEEVPVFYKWITGEVMRKFFDLSVAKVKRFDAEQKARRARRDINRAREMEHRLTAKIDIPECVAKAVAEAPKALPEVPKALPEEQKALPEVPKALPEEQKALPEVPKALPEEPKLGKTERKRNKKKAETQA